MNRRAQAAMEYLMTYGWAILVVLIALGALFYLGVFSPATPSTCSVPAPISCTDVKATTDGTVTLVMAATGTSSASLTAVSLTSPTSQSCATGLPDTVSTANPSEVGCDTGSDLTSGNRFSGTGTISYALQAGTSHTATVEFSGTVETP